VFPKDGRFGFFPGVSAGWRISEEEFWKGSSVSRVVDNLKLRGSYGSLGNQAVAGGYYPTYAVFNTGVGYNYYLGNTVNTGYAITNAANENLMWETSKMGNIALDAGLWSNKLTVSFDVFKRDIIDMLQTLSIPTYVGMTAPYTNIGRMTNKGWELAVTYRNQVNDFKYQVTGSFSDVKNTLVDNNNTPYINGALIQQEGIAVNSYYGYQALGLFQSQEEIDAAPTHWANTRPGDIRYADISGAEGTPDGKIDNYDRVVLGNSFPRYEYSANLSAQYKGFDFTAFFQGVGKRDNYLSGAGTQPFYSASYQGSMYEHQKDYWTPENTDAAYPRLTANSITNNYHASSYWIKSAAYLRLKNVVLGYTLPTALTQKAKIKSARVYISGQNLITWDKFFPGFDPEQINTGGAFYPIMRTYSAGVNIKF
jgi:TonB-linked SusC/RagA family outer membrane protein